MKDTMYYMDIYFSFGLYEAETHLSQPINLILWEFDGSILQEFSKVEVAGNFFIKHISIGKC